MRRVPWVLLLVFPVAWAALYSVSFEYWFLPAGLRMAMLWLTPTRRWPWLALAEWIGTLVATGFDGHFTGTVATIAGVMLPWVVYAAATFVVQRHARAVQYETAAYWAPFMLIAALAGAAVNAGLLSALHAMDGTPIGTSTGALLRFALGDYAGVIAVAPLMLLVAQHRRESGWWRPGLKHAAVLLPALGLVVSLWPALGVPVQYSWFLTSVPLIALGAIGGRTAAVIGIALLSVAFLWLVLLGAPGGFAWQTDPRGILVEVQRILAVAGSTALLLGARRDASHLQRARLSASIDELQSKTEALREAAARLSSQREEESRRLGLELHDQVGQDMTALATRIHLAERFATSDGMRRELRMLQQMVSSAHDHLRSVIRNLHPVALERFGLERALTHGPLSEMAFDTGIAYRCQVVGPVDTLPLDVATPIYRICQEAVTNGIRHGCGGAITIRLELRTTDSSLDVDLSIHDKAGAISLPAEAVGIGLQGIRDRAHALGAEYRFDVESGLPRHSLGMSMRGKRLASRPHSRPAYTTAERLRAVPSGRAPGP